MGKSKRISPPRWFHQFQLRRDVAFDNHIHEIVMELTRKKEFHRSVLSGIRLIWDLLYLDKEDVLLELCPNIVERLQIKLTPPSPPVDPDDIANRVLEKMQEAHQLVVVESPLVAAPALKPAGLKPLSGAKPLSLPTFDDDELDTLVLKRDTHTDASQNFMDAAFGLNAHQ